MTDPSTPGSLDDGADRAATAGKETEPTARAAMVAFTVACAGGIGAAVAYATGRTDLPLGLALTASLGGIGVGLIAWAKSLRTPEDVVQEREPLAATAEDRADLDQEGEVMTNLVRRRPLLAALFAGSLGTLAIGFVGPLGSLGPRPRGERKRTGWTTGRRLVTSDGQAVSAAGTVFDQLTTVFPDGQTNRDDSQVVLLRVKPELLTAATVAAGAVDGWVAYSKICTHAGCSVGLFDVDSRPPVTLRQLVCPCHQSVFNPLDQARPIGGPAPRPLPQLPLAVDPEGYLVAQRDFDRPVGPITWNEG